MKQNNNTEEQVLGLFLCISNSDLAGTLTQDLRNRNPTLYTTKLRGLYNVKGENGNRKTALNGERVSGIDFRFPFSLFRFFLLHALLEVVYQLAEEVVAGVAAIDGVVAVGVGELAEVLVGMDEGFGVLCHVAEVHVVVGKAVDDKQASAKVLGAGDGAAIVTLLVLLGGAHEALGVNRVIVAP